MGQMMWCHLLEGKTGGSEPAREGIVETHSAKKRLVLIVLSGLAFSLLIYEKAKECRL